MPPRCPVHRCNEPRLAEGLVDCQGRSERRSFHVFCRKMRSTAYLCLLGSVLCRGRLTRGTAAPTRGRTGSFGAAGLTGGWRRSAPRFPLPCHARTLDGMADSCRVICQSCIQCAATSGHTSKSSSSEEGITTQSDAGTINSRGGAGADARTYLTLESMAFSLHARSSSSLRRLRPAVPPIAMFRARVKTLPVDGESLFDRHPRLDMVE